MSEGRAEPARGRKAVGLPAKPFLYTIDQIAALLSLEHAAVTRSIFYEGRSVGARPKDKMLARNIDPADARPEWRVAETELIRWMRSKGFRFYERTWPIA